MNWIFFKGCWDYANVVVCSVGIYLLLFRILQWWIVVTKRNIISNIVFLNNKYQLKTFENVLIIQLMKKITTIKSSLKLETWTNLTELNYIIALKCIIKL